VEKLEYKMSTPVVEGPKVPDLNLIKVSDYVAERLAALGIQDAFSVTGGAAMHLNDSFGRVRNINVHYMHHEQACAIAAEGYARIEGVPAAVVVTAGPGSINAFNGVFGAYTDSIPMIVVSGQVRSDTKTVASSDERLRQLGDQELRTVEMVSAISKFSIALDDPNDIVAVLDLAYVTAISGRPGPVWIDIPIDIQGMKINADPNAAPPKSVSGGIPVGEEIASLILSEISRASRPVFLLGTGVRISKTQDQVLQLCEWLQVPFVTAWTHDLVATDHPLHAGRPGTIGTRPGNFVVQNSDLLIVLGSRLNIRQVSYNWENFAVNARIIHVDIDESELQKFYLDSDIKVLADLKELMPRLLANAGSGRDRSNWLDWIREVKKTYSPSRLDYALSDGGINPYHFVMALSDHLGAGDIVVCGDATACIVPFQALEVKDKSRLFSNSGAASMGYDLPAAFGASVAQPLSRVICLAGDGSIMMNLQELHTIAASGRDICVFVLENEGYLSIKQTQSNFFGASYGSSPDSGLTFPDFASLGVAFGLDTIEFDIKSDWESFLADFLARTMPRLCVVHLDREQEFEPRLKSFMTENGIQTPALDDMHPRLPKEVLERIKFKAGEIK